EAEARACPAAITLTHRRTNRRDLDPQAIEIPPVLPLGRRRLDAAAGVGAALTVAPIRRSNVATRCRRRARAAGASTSSDGSSCRVVRAIMRSMARCLSRISIERVHLLADDLAHALARDTEMLRQTRLQSPP